MWTLEDAVLWLLRCLLLYLQKAGDCAGNSELPQERREVLEPAEPDASEGRLRQRGQLQSACSLTSPSSSRRKHAERELQQAKVGLLP